ncbi:MAG: transposase [Verrucomicrobia bacterium]|nr:transposase [Verrucomicrobiota bacterium]
MCGIDCISERFLSAEKRAGEPASQGTTRISEKIEQVFKAHAQCYGSPKVTRALRQEGRRVGKNRAAQVANLILKVPVWSDSEVEKLVKVLSALSTKMYRREIRVLRNDYIKLVFWHT